ncbi:hypothetical protein H0H87_009298, partial [Tephrocybe sp. NHM501043]
MFVDGEEAAWDPDSTSHEKEWDVVVVNAPKIINAMATPGMVVVFTGILPVARDERGLSAVLAHAEIGHVVARHSAEALSSKIILWTLATAASLVLGIDVGATSVVQNYLFELPNSRMHELEADKIGLRLMARACFDPQASVDMFERLTRLEKDEQQTSVDFFRTHPSGTKRVG